MDNPKITELPERTRRIILWVSVTIISTIIAGAWLWWLPKNLAQLQPAGDDQKKNELLDLQKQLQDSIEQTNKQFDAEVAADEQKKVIEAMKNKLNGQEATTTPTSTPIN